MFWIGWNCGRCIELYYKWNTGYRVSKAEWIKSVEMKMAAMGQKWLNSIEIKWSRMDNIRLLWIEIYWIAWDEMKWNRNGKKVSCSKWLDSTGLHGMEWIQRHWIDETCWDGMRWWYRMWQVLSQYTMRWNLMGREAMTRNGMEWDAQV